MDEQSFMDMCDTVVTKEQVEKIKTAKFDADDIDFGDRHELDVYGVGIEMGMAGERKRIIEIIKSHIEATYPINCEAMIKEINSDALLGEGVA